MSHSKHMFKYSDHKPGECRKKFSAGRVFDVATAISEPRASLSPVTKRPWLSFGNFFGIGDRNLWAFHDRAMRAMAKGSN